MNSSGIIIDVEGRGHFILPANSRYLWNVRAPRQGKWQTVDNGFLRVIMKRCSVCKELKNELEFYKDKSKKSGIGSLCKSCGRVKAKKYAEENHDKKIESCRKWRATNPEKAKESYKKSHKKWISANPDKYKQVWKNWYAKNTEKFIGYIKKWVKENPEKRRVTNRKYSVSHPDEILAKSRRYHARKKESYGYISPEEWREMKKFYNFTCLSCGRKEPEIKLELDHVVPIAMGGENTISNAQPLCRSCNAKKSTKHIDYRNQFFDAVKELAEAE